MNPAIFKAYDIRGVYPTDFDEDTAYKIGQAYAQQYQPNQVVVGRDVRLSGAALHAAVCKGLQDAGVAVIDIGVISTDMMYFAVGKYGYDGGIAVTASHNPKEYNGFKLVRENAVPISGDTGLQELRELVLRGESVRATQRGTVVTKDIVDDYLEHCVSFISLADIPALRVVINANFGMAGKLFERLVKKYSLPLTLHTLDCEPNGAFPKGRPDPFLPDRRTETAALVQATGADLAIAWDADADRCFFFDAQGEFVDGYYIIAVLAPLLLTIEPGARIVIDPRDIFATTEAIEDAGGTPVMNKVGHAPIKARMRAEHALFGGENSGHYYFRENYYADNGIIPALMVLSILGRTKQSLANIVAAWKEKVHIINETNYRVTDPDTVIAVLQHKYQDGAQDEIDGLSVTYAGSWRFNVRKSNTEALLRLNIESYDQAVLHQKFDELSEVISEYIISNS